VLIYRVEDAEGEGMFTSGKTPLELYDRDEVYLGENHPTPCKDIPEWADEPRYDCIFGCKSIEDMDHWLDASFNVRQRLHEAGFYLTVSEVEDDKILYGKNQVAFPRSAANVVEVRELCQPSLETISMSF
jgi:hypothetical protein